LGLAVGMVNAAFGRAGSTAAATSNPGSGGLGRAGSIFGGGYVEQTAAGTAARSVSRTRADSIANGKSLAATLGDTDITGGMHSTIVEVDWTAAVTKKNDRGQKEKGSGRLAARLRRGYCCEG